jgi:hypothetical protein
MLLYIILRGINAFINWISFFKFSKQKKSASTKATCGFRFALNQSHKKIIYSFSVSKNEETIAVREGFEPPRSS